MGGHPNPQKAHHWVTTGHLSHKWLKSVQGFDLGRVARKLSITRTAQDRATKSYKSIIFHIFGETGKAPRKDIAMKFGTGLAEFDIENLMGVNFTGGQILGFSIDFAYGP